MNEFDAMNQCLLNHYEQLAAAVDLYLDSSEKCASIYLELLQKTLSELNEFKIKIGWSDGFLPDDGQDSAD
ncbi:MAG TPA: hypothetical protein DHV28_19400 [Ignavibacteriales bacterium]|nr:hypothetical protein [Ignavibacteriales bacterium]